MPSLRKRKRRSIISASSVSKGGKAHLSSSKDKSKSSADAPDRFKLPKSDRLYQMGFRYVPFWKTAEEGKLELMQETYSEPAGYNKLIMSPDQSSVLLASFGAGKTAGRLNLTASLEKDVDIAVRSLKNGENPTFFPLIAEYTNFESITKLPNIEDHKKPLLASIAKSVYEFIRTYHDLFQNLSLQDRDFWWAFLEAYYHGSAIIYDDIPQKLMEDLNRNLSRAQPFIQGTTLADALDAIVKRLRKLHVTTLFILVDGVDAHSSEPVLLEGLLLPLLNYLNLFSLPGLVWKFFLPDKLYETVYKSSSFHSGRLGEDILRIKWDKESLIRFLSGRLSWASDGEAVKIAQHCNQDLITSLGKETTPDDILAEMALRHTRLGPPRALLVLIEKLYRSGDQLQITLPNWENFKYEVQDDLYKESYVRDTYRSMIIGVIDKKGTAVGTASIARFRDRTFIVTCAHVIKALETNENDVKENDFVKLLQMDSNMDFVGKVIWLRPPDGKDERDWTATEDVSIIEPISGPNLKDVLTWQGAFQIEKYEGQEDCWCFGYLDGMGARGAYIEKISCETREGADFIRLVQKGNLQIGRGVSGAPLFSPRSSRIVGIIQSIYEDESGTAYLIPSYVIRNILQSLTESNKTGGAI